MTDKKIAAVLHKNHVAVGGQPLCDRLGHGTGHRRHGTCTGRLSGGGHGTDDCGRGSIKSPWGQGFTELGMLRDPVFQVATLFENQFPGKFRQVFVGMDPQIGLLDDHLEGGQFGELAVLAIGAWLKAVPWVAGAHDAPVSMGFGRNSGGHCARKK